jgi:hypothetical protein
MRRIGSFIERSIGQRVRWPFRILSVLLIAAALFAFFLLSYLAIVRHDLKAALFAISLLPIAAMLTRSGGGIVVFGRVIPSPTWPFASGLVAFVWVMLNLLVIEFFVLVPHQ